MHQENKQDLPHYVGHRKRLKDKFLSISSDSFSDYELLELCLFQVIPRKDVKPLAKKIIKEFGDFKNLLNATRERILAIDDATESVFLQIKLLQALVSRVFHDKIENENIINSWKALLDYLNFNMSSLKIEQFRALFLNKRNILIADEVMSTGTIDQTPVYPREILKKALFYDAGAIILVHNHPGGKSNPSREDIELTNQIVDACNTINVTVHDHVIIGNNNYYSFKSNLLL